LVGSVITNNGRSIILDRTFNSSPTRSQPSLYKIGTGVTDPVESDTDVETGVNINGGATATFESGYPSVDYTAKESTIRCKLLTTEGNTNSLTEFCVFNNDGTKLMFSHVVHSAIAKTTSVQIIYIQKDKCGSNLT